MAMFQFMIIILFSLKLTKFPVFLLLFCLMQSNGRLKRAFKQEKPCLLFTGLCALLGLVFFELMVTAWTHLVYNELGWECNTFNPILVNRVLPSYERISVLQRQLFYATT